MELIDFSHYKQKRLALIDDLEKGKCCKIGFIEENIKLYEHLNLPEPKLIHSPLDGIFFYQYYNTLAKHHQKTYRDLRDGNALEAAKHRILSEKFYALKEDVTLKLLTAMEFKGVEAYYVKSDSKDLNQKLIEIVLVNEEKAILHSLDDRIVKALKIRGLLLPHLRQSLISSYINKPYYKV
jgi:hypothetical protein